MTGARRSGGTPSTAQEAAHAAQMLALPEVLADGERQGADQATSGAGRRHCGHEQVVQVGRRETGAVRDHARELADLLAHRLEGQEAAVDRLRDADVDVAAEDAAGDDDRHAPEGDGDDAAELERGVQQDQERSEGAQEDVHLQPVLERTRSGPGTRTACGRCSPTTPIRMNDGAHDPEPLAHQPRGREEGSQIRERPLIQGQQVVVQPGNERRAGHAQPDHGQDERQQTRASTSEVPRSPTQDAAPDGRDP